MRIARVARVLALVVLLASSLPTGGASASVQQAVDVGVANNDFEADAHGVGCCSNVANDWTHFYRIREEGKHPAWQYHEPQYGNNRGDRRRNGNGAMSWGKDYATYDAGIWQRVKLPGASGKVTATVWMTSWSGEGNNWGDNPQANTGKLIGIDPTGNTDVWSSNVIWSPENQTKVDWVPVSVTTEAKGEFATIFIRSRNELPMHRNATFVDEVRMSLDQAPTAPPAVAAPPPAAAPARCEFKLGFKLLRDQIPQQVGDCLVDEHYNPVNGDSLQETTRGLMVWRKLDNFTAFTDGYRSWVNGPFGVQMRLNTQRFPWEPVPPPAAPTAPAAPPAAPPPPPAPPPQAAQPAPAPQLEAPPWLVGPGDGERVGEAAELKWDWHRGLNANEEFVLVLRQENPPGRTWWRGKKEKVHFTTGEELPPGRILRWKVYVRVANSETAISRESDERGVQRNP